MGKRKRQRKRDRERGVAAQIDPVERGRPREGETLVDRLHKRRDVLKRALLELLESESPGSPRILRERPAIEADIWAVEARLAAEQGDPETARRCAAEALRWSTEARKVLTIDTALRVQQLEARFSAAAELGERLDHLR